MKPFKITVVYKKSLYQLYAKERQDERVLRLLRKGSRVTKRLKQTHITHRDTLEKVRKILKSLDIKATFVYRARSFSENNMDLILSVGGDGTFLEAARSIRETFILGVNSNPEDSVGMLCGAKIETLESYLKEIIDGSAEVTKLTRLSVKINKRKLPFPILNDVLIAHSNPASTSRYLLRLRGTTEEHKSSGMWVAPAAGSTAAILGAGGRVLPLKSRNIQFVVREPYQITGKRMKLTQGMVKPNEKLVIYSKMRAGRIYLDGPHNVEQFPVGDMLEIKISRHPLFAYGFHETRRRKKRN